MANGFLRGFCRRASWDAERFRHVAFGEYTPCVVDAGLVGIVHTLFLPFLAYRLYQLRSTRLCLFATKWPQICRITLGIISTVFPILQLNARLEASGDGVALYGPGLVPFEVFHVCSVAVAWLLLALVLLMELRGVAVRGMWICRFLAVFSLGALTVRLELLLRLYKGRARDYDFYLFLAQYCCVVLSTAFAALYWPSAFLDAEYRLVAVEEFDDGEEAGHDQVCPEASSGLVSRLLFSWLSPLIKLGYSRPLEEDDIWQLAGSDRATRLEDKFGRNWAKETRLAKPSLLRALRRTFGWQAALGGLIKTLNDASQFLGPMVLKWIVQANANPDSGFVNPYVLVGILFVGQIIGALAECQYFQVMMRIGMQTRSSMVLSIFKKSTVLSPRGREGRSTGKIVNLVSSDCENLQSVTQNIHILWSSPLRIIVALYLLFNEMGPAAFVALGVLIAAVPLQKVIVTKVSKLLKSSLKSTDERIKLVNEIMMAMQVVKCYAWEDKLEERVQTTRERELQQLKKSAYLRAVNYFMISSVPIVISAVTFLTYVALGNELDAATAFTALSLFGVLRMPLFMLPSVITQVISAGVALERMQDFLLADEFGAESLREPSRPDLAVEITKSDFAWSSSAVAKPTLKDLALMVPTKQLVAVIGETGAGKSSLLGAILGEMLCISAPADEATAVVRGSIAYVPQQAWIFNATVRENILFGLPWDEDRYWRAVHVSCLAADFEQMAAGDATEIGEKGVNLSGGQKQRISLARAVYADKDVYLLDDPLSALDAHVAKQIFERCILGLLADKTVVFVTNRLEFVHSCQRVLVMRGNTIGADGSYQGLLDTDEGFRALMNDQGPASDEHADADAAADTERDDGAAASLAQDVFPLAPPATRGSIQEEGAPSKATFGGRGAAGKGDKPKTAATATLIKEEKRERGSIGLSVIRGYIAAMGGGHLFFIILLLYLLTEGSRLAASFWISIWSSHTSSHRPVSYWLGIYSGLSGLQAVLYLVNLLIIAVVGLQAGRVLHANMFGCLMKAPMSFFNSTPLGRILNRFSKDMGDIDRNLASMVTIFIRGLVQIVGTFVLIGFTIPYTLAAFAPVMTAFYWYYRYFQASNMELKRLDSITRSPVYAYFSQCLNGLASIRAYKAQGQVFEASAARIDAQVRMNLATFSANRWLSIRLEILGGAMIFIAGIFVVAMRKVLSPGDTGLALSYALSLTGLLNMTVRLAAVAENSLNSVERVLQYSKLEPERIEGAGPPAPKSWPDHGVVDFQDVSMRYRPDLPLVLKALRTRVEACQKIGICGRTGAGKSSLFLTLFRIVEACHGRIVIDGIDISKLSLKQLRSNLSIIPQDPVLFTGTLRFNLDPAGERPDQVLWDALERAHLKDFVTNQPEGLGLLIAENGDNFSVGQRQLLCLARALIRRSPILVLDEATAAVDVGTDALIQRTIREEFKDCTVLTIAHRLNTIIDSDRILVLDKGEMVEFDTPGALLSMPDGVFAGMVADTGEEMAAFLRDVAFGKIDLDTKLSEDATKPSPNMADALPTNLTLKAVAATRFQNPQLEGIRAAFATLLEAVESIASGHWDGALADAGLSSTQLLSQIQTLARGVAQVAAHTIPDVGHHNNYAVVDALTRST